MRPSFMWVNEDALPDDLHPQIYNCLYPASEIIDGCRMFPWPTCHRLDLKYQPRDRHNAEPSPKAGAVTVTEQMVERALGARVPIYSEEDGNDNGEVLDFLTPGIHRSNNARAIMRAALVAALGGDGWIALADRKPSSGIYLVFRPSGSFSDCNYAQHIGTAFYDADADSFMGDYHGPIPATHWRPLPAGAGEGA